MVRPPEAKVYNLQLHRVTLWTLGCGLLLWGGVLFLAGSLVGAWWVARPSPQLQAQATQPQGGTTASPQLAQAADGAPTTGNVTPTNAAPTVSAPVATAPSATAPTVRGPTLTGRGITGPRVTGPRAAGPRLQGPRAAVPTVGTPTAGGGRVGGGSVTVGSGVDATGQGGAGPVAPEPTAGPQVVAPSADSGYSPSADDPSPNGLSPDDLTAIIDETVAAAPSHQFAVQVGLFTNKDELKTFLEGLELDGVETYVRTLRSDLRRIVVYSVRLGPWPRRPMAEEAARNFRLDHGMGAAVVREDVEPSG